MRAALFSPRRLLWWAGAGGLTSQHRATSLWPSSSSSLLEVVKGQLKCLKWKRSRLPFLAIFSFSNLFIQSVLACCCFTMQCNIHSIFAFLLILTYLLNFVIIFYIINTMSTENCVQSLFHGYQKVKIIFFKTFIFLINHLCHTLLSMIIFIVHLLNFTLKEKCFGCEREDNLLAFSTKPPQNNSY